jgi:hypothetical protein
MDSISQSLSIWTPNLILLGLQLNLISSPTRFPLNWISYPWTLLGSDLAHPGLEPSSLELKVLIPLWTRTLSQFWLVSSIFFLGLVGQLTQLTFTQSAYPNHAKTAYLIFIQAPYPSLTQSHQCLPSLICSYPAKLPYLILLPIGLLLTRPYMVLLGQITLPDSSLDQTSTYPALHSLTRPNYLTQFFSRTDFYLPNFLTLLGNTSLHPTAYPALPNHLTQPGTLQLASPKNFLISLSPWLWLTFGR